MCKEQKFYDALKEVFVGAKVEGESGYINLMRIKSRYYERDVFPKLQKDINDALEPFPEFREELFDKLYTFFNRYFSESGSIYFRYTPIYQNVYEKVYTDDKDVILFWKTHMLYYVKTDRLFKNLEVEADGFKFFFDVSRLEHKKAFEKKELIYEFKEKRNDGVIVFNVFYSENGRITKSDEILKALKKEGIEITEEVLEKAFKVFEKQNEVDYFINKKAKEFLQEQFNIWLYQYVFSGESQWTEERIKQLQVLKNIAFKIIDFISQFEDELVKIWNKPKFVLNSNYVITLDRIADKNINVVESILDHEGFENQLKEWKELGIVDDEFDKSKILENTRLGKQLNKKYQYLPIDTKYFKDLELQILSLFDHLDNSLDGWLIKSENYQALNTILPKFKEKVQTIYIDPPYNTGSDEFIYRDRYQHSSWLSMMENRLSLAKDLIYDTSSILVSIGDTIKTGVSINSSAKLLLLMNEIFGENNFVATFVRKSGIAPRQDTKYIANAHDYIIFYSKNKDKVTINQKPAEISRLKYKDKHFDERGFFDLNQLDRGSKRYSESLDYPIEVKQGDTIEIFDGKIVEKTKSPENFVIYPRQDPKDKRWIFTWSKEKVIWGIKNDFIVFKKDKNGQWKVYYKEYELVDNNLNRRERKNPYDTLIMEAYNEKGNSEIENLFGARLFDYPKPTSLIHHLLKITTLQHSIILDFFAGSGTTAHAVMKLNKEDGGKRKFILVEMANYFDTVIIPRIKKVAYSFNWKDGKPQDNDGIGVFFKYYELEQYEDTLRRVKYEDSDLFDNPYEDPYNQYIFMKDLKMLEALEIDYENNKVKVDLSKLYPNIDIPETLSNLLGKWIRRISEDYVEFENGEKINIKDLDYKSIKRLIWWS